MAIDPAFLEQLKGLHFSARRRISSVYIGGRRSLLQGKGIEAVDHREYIPGDDFRAIDWRVYGRTEKLYVRRFEEEKSLILHLLIDASASMDFGSSGLSKFDYASSIGVGFAYLTINDQEKFAMALYSERIREVMQPRKSRTHLFRAIELINNTHIEGRTNLDNCISQYISMIKSKSFTVILSDFLEPIDSIKDGIYRIGKHSTESVLIQVLDPLEIDLAWKYDVKLQDMETNDVEEVYLSPDFKKEYKRKLEEHAYAIRGICHDAGVEFHLMRTDTPVFDAFVSLVGGESKRTTEDKDRIKNR